MNPWQWWALEEIGFCLQTNDLLCHSCSAQGSVIRDQEVTMLQEEPLKDLRSRGDDGQTGMQQ
jgi:hypothetical protein